MSGPAAIGPAPQGQAGELESCRPALRPPPCGDHVALGKIRTSQCGEHGCRLGLVEAKVLSAYFGELTPGPQPSQRQWRILPARDEQSQCLGQVRDEVLDLLVQLAAVDHVEVVEDQDIRRRGSSKLVQQYRHGEIQGPQPGGQ